MSHKDKVTLTVPLYHCFGMVIGCLAALNYGASIVLPSPGFDPATALESVTKYKTTLLYGVPTMFIALLNEYEKNAKKYNLSSLRSGFVAGSLCPEALMQKMCDVFAKEITCGYGQTECSPVVTLCKHNDTV